MEIVLLVETKNFQKCKEVLLKDDVVSRASIVFKEAKEFTGKEGYYCYISGLDEQCKRVLEIAKDLVVEVKDKEKNDVIKKIKEEENRAMEGFGGIFG